MSENPAQWGKATKLINETLEQHRAGQAAGVVGYSEAMAIADALYRDGFLMFDEIWVDQ